MIMLGASRGTTSRVGLFASPNRGGTLRRTLAPSSDTAPADGHDDLRTARGIVNGVIFAVPLWAMLGALVWLLVAR